MTAAVGRFRGQDEFVRTLCNGPKIFSLSFSHSYPHSLFQFLSHFKFQKFLSFHFTRFHFISFHFYFISFPFHFRFPSGCRSYRGRISNFNFHPAATSGAILTTLSMLRPCSVASSYKGLPPRVMCAHRRELVFVHRLHCRGQSETSSSSAKTHSMSGSLRLTSQ